jgi:PAS domain S-box-containing protein
MQYRIRARPAGRWLVLALAAFALLATGLFVAATLADRAATLEQGRTDAHNTAALLAEQVDRALRLADVTTARAAELAAQHGIEALRGARWPDLVALDSGTPEIGTLAVLDAAGRLVVTSVRRDPPPVDASDRKFFRALEADASDYLSGLRRAPLTGLWSFSWSRAIRAEGRFAGAVLASLHAEDFARLARQLELGPEATLKLVRQDGLVLMHWPMPPGAPALTLPTRAALSGEVEEIGPDGVARLVAWRAARTTPVIAVAALSRAHVLAPFQHRLQRNALLFALSLGLAGGLGLTALRAERREAAARRAAEERGAALAGALAERLNLLASLQDGRARLRMARQAGGIGLWELDLDHGRLALTGEVFGAWGPPADDGRDFPSIPTRAALRGIHPADRGALLDALGMAMARGVPLVAEFRLAGAAPDRWIGVRAEPQAGAARRLLGIALDVTPARRAQQALEDARAELEQRVVERTSALAEANGRLRAGEARFRGLFNATFQFIGLLAPDGTVLEANAAMLRLIGLPAEAVIGRCYRIAPWWPDDAATRALVHEALAEAAAGRFARREAAMRDGSGRLVAVDFSVTPVFDEQGAVALLVAEARDISALKATQALLHEAQKMDTLGQLTGGVAHDFNNLLMAVLGNLAVARRRAEEHGERRRVDEHGEQRHAAEAATPRDLLRHIDAATQAAERGAVLTQRLLAFARRQDLKPQAVDLRALLLGVEALLRRSAGPLVTLEIATPEGLPAAQADPHALELALVNLAVNARDAMPEGGRLAYRLGVAEGEAPAQLAPGRWLTIAVTDTGAGMDGATLARAVEPFFTTKGPGRGTGLGLSMVHGLAAQSGGALVLRSAPGQGTTATLWLPVATARPMVVASAAAPAVAPAQTGRGAVLVVDDEPLVLESTAAMLEELGYGTVCAESAEAALAMLDARPDVVAVLTDHAMPGMTGTALAARLRAERPGLPVILASGYAGAWSAEPDAPPRLAKPYSLAQLSAALSGAVAQAAE